MGLTFLLALVVNDGVKQVMSVERFVCERKLRDFDWEKETG